MASEFVVEIDDRYLGVAVNVGAVGWIWTDTEQLPVGIEGKGEKADGACYVAEMVVAHCACVR